MVNSPYDVKIAVIGGSGLYHLEGLEYIEEVNPETVKYSFWS
jgi:5'-methylthioadenosine phosphorylase